jgi:hypothetical protein
MFVDGWRRWVVQKAPKFVPPLLEVLISHIVEALQGATLVSTLVSLSVMGSRWRSLVCSWCRCRKIVRSRVRLVRPPHPRFFSPSIRLGFGNACESIRGGRPPFSVRRAALTVVVVKVQNFGRENFVNIPGGCSLYTLSAPPAIGAVAWSWQPLAV